MYTFNFTKRENGQRRANIKKWFIINNNI